MISRKQSTKPYKKTKGFQNGSLSSDFLETNLSVLLLYQIQG